MLIASSPRRMFVLRVLVAIVATGCTFFLLASTKLSPHHHLRITTTTPQDRRSLLSGGYDPKSVVAKHGHGKNWFRKPTIVHQGRGSDDTHDAVVDVLSIGSEKRIELMEAQKDTWASTVRNFWGFTESHDFDVECPSMSDDALLAYTQTCKSSPLGWDDRFAEFRMRSHYDFGSAPAGWFCAQRRPGRALGWLKESYQNEQDLPDILMIVDDDTYVNIEKMRKLKAYKPLQQKNIPFIGAGYIYDLVFSFPMGGNGLFINKVALQSMMQPIFCNGQQEQSEYVQNVCSNLQKNRVGELAVFEEGDSVVDVFHKFSGTDFFCMHSDWATGYMIEYYSGGTLRQIGPQGRQIGPQGHDSGRCPNGQCRRCDMDFFTCHKQTAEDMERVWSERRSSLKT